MKASELLVELKNQFTKKPDKYQYDIFNRKYASIEPALHEKATATLKDYGNILASPIIQVMTDDERAKLGNTIITAIPLSSINARTYKVDDNEYLIAINERLLALIFAWGELQILPFIGDGTIPDNFAQVFSPVIDCYLTPNSGCALPVFSFEEIPKEITPFLVLKAQCAEQFIVAHELAHIVLGHLDSAKACTFHEDSYAFNAEAYNVDQQKEYDADIQAVQWMKKRFESQEMQNQFLFLCVEVFVLFHYIECNLGFPKKTGSHPSALSRLINMQNYFPDIEGIAEMVQNCEDINSFKIVTD